MRTIFVLFGDYHEAGSAVTKLMGKGFDTEDMNVIVQASALHMSRAGRLRLAGKGRMTGMDLLVSSARPVNLPGAGEAYAAGREAEGAAAATGEGAGASLADFFAELKVPEELAELYESGISEGGILLWLRVAEERFMEASDILAAITDSKVANYN